MNATLRIGQIGGLTVVLAASLCLLAKTDVHGVLKGSGQKDLPIPDVTPQPSNDCVRSELIDAVRGHLEALRRQDGAGAAVSRSSRRGLSGGGALPIDPLLRADTAVDFGPSVDDGDEAILLVSVPGKNDRKKEYHFVLHHEGRRWRISGAFAGRPPDSALGLTEPEKT